MHSRHHRRSRCTPPPAEAPPEEGYEVVPALSSKVKELAEEIKIAVDQLQEFNSGLMSSLETISKFLERIEDGGGCKSERALLRKAGTRLQCLVQKPALVN
ncbi:hypothetical protein HPB52_006358 [Rhipicephalus sanguineus]|uniref:Uncharacterized protein n=1 Tax=Rhipicephalus sanguineus TaxID=34632 RepID=A0A9D4QDK6_RHISA|nr:hypothetical protein HPB52_006358 [Rhipicephalus sanguineus]